jgi:hypothetical protein
MIASTDKHNNQQTMEVSGWGDGDDGNGQGWLIAWEEGKEGDDDQTMSADATTATSKEQCT